MGRIDSRPMAGVEADEAGAVVRPAFVTGVHA